MSKRHIAAAALIGAALLVTSPAPATTDTGRAAADVAKPNARTIAAQALTDFGCEGAVIHWDSAGVLGDHAGTVRWADGPVIYLTPDVDMARVYALVGHECMHVRTVAVYEAFTTDRDAAVSAMHLYADIVAEGVIPGDANAVEVLTDCMVQVGYGIPNSGGYTPDGCPAALRDDAQALLNGEPLWN